MPPNPAEPSTYAAGSSGTVHFLYSAAAFFSTSNDPKYTELAGTFLTMVVKSPWNGPRTPLSRMVCFTHSPTDVYGAAQWHVNAVLNAEM